MFTAFPKAGFYHAQNTALPSTKTHVKPQIPASITTVHFGQTQSVVTPITLEKILRDAVLAGNVDEAAACFARLQNDSQRLELLLLEWEQYTKLEHAFMLKDNSTRLKMVETLLKSIPEKHRNQCLRGYTLDGLAETEDQKLINMIRNLLPENERADFDNRLAHNSTFLKQVMQSQHIEALKQARTMVSDEDHTKHDEQIMQLAVATRNSNWVGQVLDLLPQERRREFIELGLKILEESDAYDKGNGRDLYNYLLTDPALF